MESGKKSLEELVTAGVFHVPEYQRYYSWTELEWDDLWTDLYTLPKGKQHYFGTFIIQETKDRKTGGTDGSYGGSSEKRINLLIDGQQRLTSLALLVKSMTEQLEVLAPQTDHEEEILDDVEEMRETLHVEDNIYQLELLDEEDNDYLERVIDGRNVPDPERPSQRKMIDAKEFFDERISELTESPEAVPIEVANELKQLWETILKLELMVYVVDAGSPEKATLIFDSVNDRGRSLSTFDKTKSFLMRMAYLAAEEESEAYSAIRRIRQEFGEMYNYHQTMLESPYVGDISDDAVQRYHFISFFDWSTSEEHSDPTFLDELKSNVRTLRMEDPEECLEYITNYTSSLERGFKALADILDRTGDGGPDDLIDRIHKLRHATKFYPILLKAWPNFDDEERYELLKAIETYIFRVYSIGNHRSHTGESSLYIRARDLDEESPLDVWVSEIANIMKRYEDDSQFRRSLRSSNLYSKVTSQDLRYLFYFYNQHRAAKEKEKGSISLAEAMGSDYTVEHIWPQTPDELPLEDAGEYPSPEARYEAYVDRLGNLTLASGSWNSSWGNAPFETKRDEGYPNSKLWVQSDVGENYEEWSVENIEDREETLMDFVFEHWPTPETRLGGIENPTDAIEVLTHEERYVLRALCENESGAVRRVIHRQVSSLPDSPFENPESAGKERGNVGSILGRLRSVGLAERNKHTWYPSEEAISANVSLPAA
ncbi:DUF262 domain-containing protein [Halobellus limi]|uniref:Uncharacterized conserved protein, contains ParB-like and HNH nuclease domains n=1 Tax=Halobellus limi TaxID=699433 RepID=A0A1H6ANR8_9EURY|nr:DUF262 domain-containing protein [Halobellus limi]SEG50369.1 Uncharacterized conserved protein, contains ParB-like and HNH nuclease domains [Halobellus limi]